MIPVSMLAANPDVNNRVSDVTNKKICRFCLTESAFLLDFGGDENKTNTKPRTLLASCFSVSPVIEDKLPKYACKQCYDFVKKFCEFQKLRRKSELMLMSYPLTGSWPQGLDVPGWLKSDKKRKLSVEDSLQMKRICSNESRDSEVITGLNNSEDIPAVTVSSHEPTEVQSTLQSPTITSEDLEISPVIQSLVPQNVAASVININHALGPYLEKSQPILHHNQSSQNFINLRNQTVDDSSDHHLYKHSDLYAPCFQSSSHVHQQLQFQQSSPLYQLTQQVNSLHQPLVTKIQPPSTIQPPQPTFQCSTCSYRFLHQKHFNFHNRQHLGQEGFHCGPCGERFQWLAPFVGHLEQKHLEASFCYLCAQKVSRDLKHLHLQHHLSAKFAYGCDFCFLIFTSQAGRLEHYKQMHQDDAWKTMQLNSAGKN